MSLDQLAHQIRESSEMTRLLELARDEDMGIPMHDWTGELMFDSDDRRSIVMRARDHGIAAGLAFIDEIRKVFDDKNLVQFEFHVQDGDSFVPGTDLVSFRGSARVLVAMERTLLNLISRMCGIAAHTQGYVDLVSGSNAQICDTRKTTPGLRLFEKYAVRCGRGTNHRFGLHDAVLVKDNHLAGLPGDGIGEKLEGLRSRVDQINDSCEQDSDQREKIWFIQVEVDTLDQLKSVLEAKTGTVDMVLLDNMSLEELRAAVDMRNSLDMDGTHRILLEASGGVNMDTVKGIAETGVDRVSIGGLTHQATSLDLGFDSIE